MRFHAHDSGGGFARCLTLGVLAATAFGCSSSKVHHTSLVPQPSGDVLVGTEASGSWSVDEHLGAGAGVREIAVLESPTERVTLRLAEYEELVRLDVWVKNKMERPLVLGPSLFALFDQHHLKLRRLTPHDAANVFLVDSSTSLYAPKESHDASSSSAASVVGAAGEAPSDLELAQNIYEIGLIDGTVVSPGSETHVGLYWENTPYKSYPLRVDIPGLGHNVAFQRDGAPADAAPAVPGGSARMSEIGYGHPTLRPNQPSTGPWVTAHGGYGTYVMSDLNDEIRALNEAADENLLDEVSNGLAFGADAGMTLMRGLEGGVGYERLVSGTSYSDQIGSVDYSLPGNVFKGWLMYRPAPTSRLNFGVGFAAGVVMTSGKLAFEVAGSEALEANISGTDLHLEGVIAPDFWVTPRFALEPTIGYRHSKVRKIEIEEQPVYTENGDRYSLDYSGMLFRLAMKIR